MFYCVRDSSETTERSEGDVADSPTPRPLSALARGVGAGPTKMKNEK